jgi:hypothetical protein
MEPSRNARHLSGSTQAHPQRQARFRAGQARHAMLQPRKALVMGEELSRLLATGSVKEVQHPN